MVGILARGGIMSYTLTLTFSVFIEHGSVDKMHNLYFAPDMIDSW